MEVLDVKFICGGHKITKNNQTEVAIKTPNDMCLKQIMKNGTKNVTHQNFFILFFLTCLNLSMKCLQKMLNINVTKHRQIQEY